MSQYAESLPIRTQEGSILVFWEDVKQYGNGAPPLFASVLMVRVSVPGDNKASVEREAQVVYQDGAPHSVHGKFYRNEETWRRYGKYIEEYKAREGGPQAIVGTPIDQCPFVNRAMVHNLRHNGIYSAEDLAGLPDAGIAAIGMGGRKLVQQARDFLSAKTNTAAAMQAQERERKTEERLRAMELKYENLMAVLDALPTEVQEEARQMMARKQSGRRAAA